MKKKERKGQKAPELINAHQSKANQRFGLEKGTQTVQSFGYWKKKQKLWLKLETP